MRRRFIYYIPGVNGVSEKMLMNLGLYDRFIMQGGRLGTWVVRKWEGGPDGGSGALVVEGSGMPEFNPELQTWVQGPKYWVGVYTAQKPTPGDLIRHTGLDGYSLQLADGNVWCVPLVLKWNREKVDHEINVPKIFAFVDGKVKKTPHPDFKVMVNLAQKIWDSFIQSMTGEPVIISETEAFEFAAKFLRVNYRLDLVEICLLGLFDSELIESLFNLVVDQPGFSRHRLSEQSHGLALNAPVPDKDVMEAAARG